jgi:sulfur carrier protein ThiS
MELRIQILGETEREKRLRVAEDATYERVVEELGINLEEVLVLRDGVPVPDDERVAEKGALDAEITIIRIVSRG